MRLWLRRRPERLTGCGRGWALPDVVGQATGMLMERYKLGPRQAVSFLEKAGRDTKKTVREVADELVRTGDINL